MTDSLTRQKQLRALLSRLYSHYGPQDWWPAESEFEVIAGAFLVQNTNWKNAEQAVANLRQAKMLSVEAVLKKSEAALAELVRPSGFFRQKAARLKAFAEFAGTTARLSRILRKPLEEIRPELLALPGIGPETADSILLYAADHPVFVVDAYARRVITRHDIFPDAATAKYETLREFVELSAEGLTFPPQPAHNPSHPPSKLSRRPRPANAQVMNEAHALFVRVGIDYCRAKPRCEVCPLWHLLPNTPTT